MSVPQAGEAGLPLPVALPLISVSASLLGLGGGSPAPLLIQPYLNWDSYSLLISIWLLVSLYLLIGTDREDRWST